MKIHDDSSLIETNRSPLAVKIHNNSNSNEKRFKLFNSYFKRKVNHSLPSESLSWICNSWCFHFLLSFNYISVCSQLRKRADHWLLKPTSRVETNLYAKQAQIGSITLPYFSALEMNKAGLKKFLVCCHPTDPV